MGDTEGNDTDNGATLTTGFIDYAAAMKILREKWQARSHDLAMGIFRGPNDGGIAAYQNANELNPPPRFYIAGCLYKDYLVPLMSCWFLLDDVNRFEPTDRFITGAELIERWGKNPDLHPKAFILAKIAESRLESIHPTFGITQGQIDDDANLPPLAAGLFALSQIEQIEAEDGLDSNPLLPNSNVKPDTCVAKYPFYFTDDLLTLQEAITETGIDVRQLLKFARLDADLLEILFLVDRKNIEQPVSSPEMSNLAGNTEYLAVPSENINSLIDRGETTTQIFRLPKYAPSSVWLLDFRQLLLISGIKGDEVRTISSYKIRLDLDSLKVVRKQIEALPSVKKSSMKGSSISQHITEQPKETEIPICTQVIMAKHAGVTSRQIRNWIEDYKDDKDYPFFNLKGKKAVHESVFDAWMKIHKLGKYRKSIKK